MFKVSRRLDYGLQLMVSLAEVEDNRAQSTASLSKKLSIPLPFLHQIAHSLMQSGYIKATPGPHGGLRLNHSPETITILQIVEALEGAVNLNPCQENSDEDQQTGCTSQLLWNDLQTKIMLHLESVTLSMLLHQNKIEDMYMLTLTKAENHRPIEIQRN